MKTAEVHITGTLSSNFGQKLSQAATALTGLKRCNSCQIMRPAETVKTYSRGHGKNVTRCNVCMAKRAERLRELGQ